MISLKAFLQSHAQFLMRCLKGAANFTVLLFVVQKSMKILVAISFESNDKDSLGVI